MSQNIKLTCALGEHTLGDDAVVVNNAKLQATLLKLKTVYKKYTPSKKVCKWCYKSLERIYEKHIAPVPQEKLGENALEKPFKYPEGFVDRNKAQPETRPEANTIPEYNKCMLYPRPNMEFQQEELRAYYWLTKRGKATTFTKEGDEFWLNRDINVKLRKYPNFATKSKLPKDEIMTEYFEPPQNEGLVKQLDKVYNSKEKEEYQLEVSALQEGKKLCENIMEPRVMEDIVCTSDVPEFGSNNMSQNIKLTCSLGEHTLGDDAVVVNNAKLQATILKLNTVYKKYTPSKKVCKWCNKALERIYEKHIAPVPKEKLGENALEKPFKYPEGFVDRNKAQPETRPEPNTIPEYNKCMLYPRPNMEFQHEELRAYYWLTKRGKATTFTKEGDEFWLNRDINVKLRKYPNFATKSKLPKDEIITEYFEPPQNEGLVKQLDEVYNSKEKEEYQLEVSALQEGEKLYENIMEPRVMEDIVCTSDVPSPILSFSPLGRRQPFTILETSEYANSQDTKSRISSLGADTISDTDTMSQSKQQLPQERGFQYDKSETIPKTVVPLSDKTETIKRLDQYVRKTRGNYSRKAEASMDQNVNPFSSDFKMAFLDNKFTQLPNCDTRIIAPGVVIRANSEEFKVSKLIGQGAYGRVYCVEHKKSCKKYALKQESPPNYWEYYICLEISSRLKAEELGPAFMHIDYALVAHNSSILISEFSPYGSLIAVCNKIKKSTMKNVDEYVVMHLTCELLDIMDHLHAISIIHADIKADNFLLMNKLSYPSQGRALQLIDFGEAIDMKLYKPGQTFTYSHKKKIFKCVEMHQKRPWTYQLDLYGLAGIIHCLLFMKDMEVVQRKNGSWMPITSVPRYFNRTLWETVFTTLLNVRDCGSMPNLQYLRAQLKEELAGKEKYVINKISEFNRALLP